MIRNTDTALAAPILYEYYCQFKGKNILDIFIKFPKKPKIKFEPELGDGGALVDLSTYVIQLPILRNKHKLYFLTCHELAHIILQLNNFIHIVTTKPGYWIQEAWCDNFALALTLVLFNIEAIDQSEDTKTFFSIGVEVRDENSRNATIAQQIKNFCRNQEMSPQLTQFYESFTQMPSLKKGI